MPAAMASAPTIRATCFFLTVRSMIHLHRFGLVQPPRLARATYRGRHAVVTDLQSMHVIESIVKAISAIESNADACAQGASGASWASVQGSLPASSSFSAVPSHGPRQETS